MESDYQIVALPPSLRAVFGYRHLRIEAIELTESAIFRGACIPPPYARAGEPVKVPTEHVAALEQLFAEVSRAGRGPEYHDARHASGRARDAARGVKASRNTCGTLHSGRRAMRNQ